MFSTYLFSIIYVQLFLKINLERKLKQLENN